MTTSFFVYVWNVIMIKQSVVNIDYHTPIELAVHALELSPTSPLNGY